jgi:hypothetical protein
MTYGIDAPTGRLHPPITQHIGDARMLASDPSGRCVYAGYEGCGDSPWCCHGPVSIVQYVPSPLDGALAPVSEVPVTEGTEGEWVWLAAGTNRVHGLRAWRWSTTCHHTNYYYLSVAVGSDGQLGDLSYRVFPDDEDVGYATVDVRSDMLYKAGRTADRGGLGGLAAHAIQADGQLRQTGWTDLCVATTMPPIWSWWDAPEPLVAARGFLFASVRLPSEERTLCSYQGQRLKPLANLGFTASVAEALVPASESQSVLLAMGVEVPAGKATRHELRLFSMNAAGDLQLLDSKDLMREVQKLAFHPSGRFLYVSDTADTLFGYAIGPEGRLEPTESIDHAGGGMAITLPAPGN